MAQEQGYVYCPRCGEPSKLWHKAPPTDCYCSDCKKADEGLIHCRDCEEWFERSRVEKYQGVWLCYDCQGERIELGETSDEEKGQ